MIKQLEVEKQIDEELINNIKDEQEIQMLCNEKEFIIEELN